MTFKAPLKKQITERTDGFIDDCSVDIEQKFSIVAFVKVSCNKNEASSTNRYC